MRCIVNIYREVSSVHFMNYFSGVPNVICDFRISVYCVIKRKLANFIFYSNLTSLI